MKRRMMIAVRQSILRSVGVHHLSIRMLRRLVVSTDRSVSRGRMHDAAHVDVMVVVRMLAATGVQLQLQVMVTSHVVDRTETAATIQRRQGDVRSVAVSMVVQCEHRVFRVAGRHEGVQLRVPPAARLLLLQAIGIIGCLSLAMPTIGIVRRGCRPNTAATTAAQTRGWQRK